EDGIRDATVTGVQTCALPISRGRPDTPRRGLRLRLPLRRGVSGLPRAARPLAGPLAAARDRDAVPHALLVPPERVASRAEPPPGTGVALRSRAHGGGHGERPRGHERQARGAERRAAG